MKDSKTQSGSWLWRGTALLRTGAGLALLAVSLVGLRLLWIHIQRPAHLEEIASAYGSIRDFYGPIQMNHDGSQFIFVAAADDRGRSIFLCDALTGKKQQVIEDRDGLGIWKADFNVQAGPWSPDDSCFLGVVSNRLMACSTNPNLKQVVIEDKPFSEAVWLTPTKFTYVTDGTNLCLAQKRGDGSWEHKIFRSEDVSLNSLTAISADEVAWLEFGSVICRANFSQGLPETNSVPVKTDYAAPPEAGLTLWLDASRLRQSDLSQVFSLPDLSRQKKDAIWNGTPPIFNGTNNPLALNGKGTIHFGWLGSVTNGTGLKTRTPLGITGTAPRSVFVVMRHETNHAMMVSMGDTSAHGALFALEWSERLFLPTGWWADNYVDQVSTNWNLLEVVYDGTSQKGYLNGLLRCTARVALNTVERGVRIGFRDGSDAKAAEGDFAELLVYDRALKNTERKQVEDYLNAKWFGKISPPNPLVWYDPGLDGLTGMDYSKETRSLLLDRTDNGQDSVWRLDTAAGPNASPSQVMQGQSIFGAQWAGPNQFVYASRLDARAWVMLADVSGNKKKQLLQFWGNGNFDWFRMAPDQKQLFLFGNISNAPAAGIWRNDLASDAWRPVISVSDYPTVHAPVVITSHNTLFVPGGQVTYTLYQPENFDKNKKYPLVLGDTTFYDPLYRESFQKSMAACGARVAMVERRDWTFQLDQWATNVMALYRSLAADPSVDTRRVYLVATSAETQYLSQLVKINPALWRGLILLNPSELPDFSNSSWLQSRPKIMLDAGGDEHAEDRFKKYQRDALNSGVVVEFYTYPGENHQIVASADKLERTRHLMRFIFEE